MLVTQMHAPLPDQAKILLLELSRTTNQISVANHLHLLFAGRQSRFASDPPVVATHGANADIVGPDHLRALVGPVVVESGGSVDAVAAGIAGDVSVNGTKAEMVLFETESHEQCMLIGQTVEASGTRQPHEPVELERYLHDLVYVSAPYWCESSILSIAP